MDPGSVVVGGQADVDGFAVGRHVGVGVTEIERMTPDKISFGVWLGWGVPVGCVQRAYVYG